MTLNQLRYFCTASRCHSITKAAEELYVTQPTDGTGDFDRGAELWRQPDSFRRDLDHQPGDRPGQPSDRRQSVRGGAIGGGIPHADSQGGGAVHALFPGRAADCNLCAAAVFTVPVAVIRGKRLGLSDGSLNSVDLPWPAERAGIGI